MPTPSSLAIATSSINRLVKEKEMYKKELVVQQARIERQEARLREAADDENAEFQLNQEVCPLSYSSC